MAAKKKYNTGLSKGAEEMILDGVTGIVKEATDIINQRSDENTAIIIGGIDESSKILSQEIDKSAKAISEKVDDSAQAVSKKVDDSAQAVSKKVDDSAQAVSKKVDNGIKTISDKIDAATGHKSIGFIIFAVIASVILGFVIFWITGHQAFLVPDYDVTGNFLGSYHRDPWTYFVSVLIPLILAVFLIYVSNWGYRKDEIA